MYNLIRRRLYPFIRSRRRSFDVVTRLGAGKPRNRFPFANRANRFIGFPKSKTSSGPHSASIQWVLGAFCLEVKRPGREADDALPCSVKFKSECSCIFAPSYAFIAFAWTACTCPLLIYKKRKFSRWEYMLRKT